MKGKNMYIFKKSISVYGQYALSDDEYEEIAENADDIQVIRCENCYAILVQNENLNVLLWAMNLFELNRKVVDDNLCMYVDVQIENDFGSKEIRLPCNNFLPKKLDNLAKYDIFCDSDDDTHQILSRYFLKQISAMKIESADISVGFVKLTDGSYYFSGYNDEDKDKFAVQNSYGSKEKYITELNKLIKDSVPLQFAISASVSSMILAYLSIFYNVPVKSFIINLVGKSSTGKTTAQELAASMYSSIDDKKIYSPFFGTENAVLRSLEGIGVCKVFDESTCVSSFNRETFIYSVSNEQEKRRMNSNGSIRSSGKWKTIPIISSEEAFMESSSNRHQGLAVRLHKYHNLAYTLDKNHAEMVHKIACENYGIIAKAMSEYLMSDEADEIETYYNECKDYMRELIDKDICSLSERLINQYAVIILSAELMAETGLEVNSEKIAELLLEHHKTIVKTTDLARNAYEVLMNFISRNPYNTGIKMIEDKKEVAVVESLFVEILNKNGFRDIKTVVDELDSQHYTKRREKNRKKVKLSINGNSCFCYLLDTSKFEDDKENCEK